MKTVEEVAAENHRIYLVAKSCADREAARRERIRKYRAKLAKRREREMLSRINDWARDPR